MKYIRAAVILTLVSLLAGLCFQLVAQPPSQSSETVAKPKKKDAPKEAADEPKIPSAVQEG